MKVIKHNIADFQKDASFYGKLDLLLTVKSFDLQAIRKRYLSSRANKTGKTGSVERRKPSKGGVVSIQIESGEITDQTILAQLFEPRGIDSFKNKLAIAAENTVHVFDEEGEYFRITDPWFSYIHTVEFSPHKPDTILISSSGFDLIQEYNYKTNELEFEWLAWENGFNKATDPETNEEILLTRNTEDAKYLKKEKVNYYLVSNPEQDHLPTAKRAAFINSVSYHPNSDFLLLATFFHEGKVYEINKKTKKASAIIEDLKNPHGGHKTDYGYIATSTASGEVIIESKDTKLILDFSRLQGKPSELGDMEWIQNTLSKNQLMVAIDSNRTSFVVIDFEQQLYDMIPYNHNWAVQDLIFGKATKEQKKKLSLV
ncbi:MAG: hypothetical protein JJ971_06640 [Balneolaceae bacterium]|nr:hypothetical protein [Balneolaceae bacterium]MBO6546052.1 hypothetical protein [Balneolaceae bacterium]MBO6647448.1 hypothetical protein [Balneolaceae bacterium]